MHKTMAGGICSAGTGFAGHMERGTEKRNERKMRKLVWMNYLRMGRQHFRLRPSLITYQ